MKKALLIFGILVLGMGLLLYPRLAYYLSETNGTKAVQEYSGSVQQLDAQTLQEEWDKAVDYNGQLSGNPVRDPFVPGSGMVLNENYHSILNVEGKMGSIEIPKIKLNLPIYHGTSEETLQKGIGHLEGSSLPVGGTGTHAVLTGHRGLLHARLFTNLVELQKGDIFYLHILDQVLAYRIDQIQQTEPGDVSPLKTDADQDYVTLITCTPYGINTHRLLVRGVRIPYEPEAAQAQEDLGTSRTWTQEERILCIAAAGTGAVMLLLILVAILVRRKRDKAAVIPPKTHWWDAIN